MKKSISFILLVCLLMIYVLPVNAETHPYSFDEAIVVTEDSFSQLFKTDHIDQVTYDYQFDTLQENDFQAHVILEISLKINNVIYCIVTEGIVDSHQLNNGDILWEGPLDGEMLINGESYSVITGFNLLDSTQESMISLTLQSNSTLVAISFGTNIVTESVLDFFMSQSNNKLSNSNTVTIETQFDNLSPENSYSTNVFGPGFSEITHPGDGGGSLNLGPNGEWEYQSIQTSKHGNTSYNAIKSRVYFDDTSNLLMVTFTPFSGDTDAYVKTLGYDFASASLDSFSIQLILEYENGPNYAYIAGIDKPSEALAINNYFNGVMVNLIELFASFLGDIDISFETVPNLFAETFENANGYINIEEYLRDTKITIQKDAWSDYRSFDNISTGLPFRFQLTKGSATNYEGNTAYTVNTSATYFVLAQNNSLFSEPTYIPFYITKTTTHEGTVTLS